MFAEPLMQVPLSCAEVGNSFWSSNTSRAACIIASFGSQRPSEHVEFGPPNPSATGPHRTWIKPPGGGFNWVRGLLVDRAGELSGFGAVFGMRKAQSARGIVTAYWVLPPPSHPVAVQRIGTT